MKYIISESQLEEVILKSIKRTLGEFRKLRYDERYDERYNPPPFKFELMIPFDYGFYKNGGYTVIVNIIADSSAIVILEEGYYNTIKSIFGLKDKDIREMIANVVKEHIHPHKIRGIYIR